MPSQENAVDIGVMDSVVRHIDQHLNEGGDALARNTHIIE